MAQNSKDAQKRTSRAERRAAEAAAMKARAEQMEKERKQQTIIGGIVRGAKVFIAVDNMEINPYDRVVVFAMPGSVGKVGYYFN